MIFRKMSNNGVWQKGQTYTFEVYEPGDMGEYGSCVDPVYGSGYLITGAGLYGSDDEIGFPAGNGCLLFNDCESNLSDYVSGTEYTEREDLEDDWAKYTIHIPDDLDGGNYYLKYSTYEFCEIIG